MRKNSRHKFVQQAVDTLELPKDLVYRAAIVTVTGNRELIIENYKGILEYETQIIRVQAKNCRIAVWGRNLNIPYYTNDEMKITGIIQSIAYE